MLSTQSGIIVSPICPYFWHHIFTCCWIFEEPKIGIWGKGLNASPGSALPSKTSTDYGSIKIHLLIQLTKKPARTAQWLEHSTWILEVVDLIPGLVNLTIINCLSYETLNRGTVGRCRCYTPSTLKNQAELSVVSSCILALSPVTTNRLLGASLRWATGSDDE